MLLSILEFFFRFFDKLRVLQKLGLNKEQSIFLHSVKKIPFFTEY